MNNSIDVLGEGDFSSLSPYYNGKVNALRKLVLSNLILEMFFWF